MQFKGNSKAIQITSLDHEFFTLLDYWTSLVFLLVFLSKSYFFIFLRDPIVLLCTIYSLREPSIRIIETYEKNTHCSAPFSAHIRSWNPHYSVYWNLLNQFPRIHIHPPSNLFKIRQNILDKKRPEHQLYTFL